MNCHRLLKGFYCWCICLCLLGAASGLSARPSQGDAAGQSDRSTLEVKDIVGLLQAGLPESIVLSKIKQRGKPFELSTKDLISLKAAGATENIMLLMMDPTAEPKFAAPLPAATTAGHGIASNSPFAEVGVYYKKTGEWKEVMPEIVNWKTGGVLKHIASAGIVKQDVNGHLPGLHSRNSVALPLDLMIHTPDGVSITEYQLIRLREKKQYREFRTVTGGVFHAESGAMRDMVPFEWKKIERNLYSILLVSNFGAGEYGIIWLGNAGAAGGLTSIAMGKMYTFRVVE